jgi:phosphate transport system protein
MAVDLRAIVAAVKINTDLRRVGDLSINIAEAAQLLSATRRSRNDRHPAHGDHRPAHAARRARRLRPPRDTELAQHILNEDDALDALKTQIFRELLTYMLQDPATIDGPRPDPRLASPGTYRRPRHQRRRGRHLHGARQRRAVTTLPKAKW